MTETPIVHAVNARPLDRAAGTCLLCLTIDRAVTQAGLLGGAYWRCARCGQTWDAARLTAAAAYAEHVAAQ